LEIPGFVDPDFMNVPAGYQPVTCKEYAKAAWLYAGLAREQTTVNPLGQDNSLQK
jgi:hypothetical protein